MEQRRLRDSDLELPVVTFGAWAIGGLFWGGSDDQDAISAIHASIDAGVNAIDTAPIYGCGHSERIVGQAIRGRRDQVKILTKCGIRWDTTEGEHHFTIPAPGGGEVVAYRTLRPESIVQECEGSLQRLGIETIDLYQVHTHSNTATAEEAMGALVRLKEQGKIQVIGVSNYSSQQMEEACRHAPIASNQIRYNLLEQSIEEDALPHCRRYNIGVIAYSPMAMGLLTGKVTMDRTFPETDTRSWRPLFQPDVRRQVLEALEKIRPIANAHQATLGQLAVAWVIAQEGITTALVGARNATQAAENAAAGRIRLSTREQDEVRQAFEHIQP
jgi:aryl-alcohol dehydrogenase-like predicted oxidoreductase